MSTLRVVCCLALIASLAAVAAAGGPPGEVEEVLAAVPAGEVQFSPQLGFHTEAFRQPAEISAALDAAEVGQRVVLAEFPVAPDERRRVELVRWEVYAPEARVFALSGGKHSELPRSRPDGPRVVLGRRHA